jgi:hypothetical protein
VGIFWGYDVLGLEFRVKQESDLWNQFAKKMLFLLKKCYFYWKNVIYGSAIFYACIEKQHIEELLHQLSFPWFLGARIQKSK